MRNSPTKYPGVAGTVCMVLLWGSGFTVTNAQQVVSTAGGDASGSGGTAAFTVGQVVYVTYTDSGSDASAAEGVQQSYSESELPVTLVNFDAAFRKNEGVLVSWTTTAELNNDYFAVERSADGKKFEEIAQVKGRGISTGTENYRFVDHFPYQGNSYYRLKQTDFDGSFEYSTMKAVVVAQLPNSLSVYPNPTTDYLNIETSGLKSENLSMRITDLSGKLLETKQISRSQSPVDLRSLHPAMYLITVFHQNSVARTFKVIKN